MASRAHQGGQRAYVTVLSTDSYLEGLLALNESLRLCKSAHPLHAVVGSGVTDAVRRVVSKAGITSIRGQAMAIPDEVRHANLESDYHKHWSGVFEKLLVFSLTQFEKLVYLDSDMIVLRNLDHLFGWPHMSGVAADIVPGRSPPVYLNAGLMVIEPQEDLTARLLDSVEEVFESEKSWRRSEGRPISMGVQSVINAFWSDWRDRDDLHLAEKYNVLTDHLDYYKRELGYRWSGSDGMCVLHFIGASKPWMFRLGAAGRHVVSLLGRQRPSEALAFCMHSAMRQKARFRLRSGFTLGRSHATPSGRKEL